MLTSALGFSACASLPEGENSRIFDSRTPETWRAVPTSGDALASTEWWLAYNDPLLTATVTRAVGANPQIFAADAAATQARATAVIAGADRLPTLDAGFGVQQGEASRIKTDSYGPSLSAAWELDVWGKVAAQSSAARERYLASIDALRGTRQSIAGLTVQAYISIVEARQQVALSARTLEVLTETARQVGNRADAGIGSPSDKFLAFTNRDSAAASLAQNEQTLSEVLRAIEVLLGEYPDGTFKTAQSLSSAPPLPAIGIPADLLARRPDVAEAERRLRATGFDLTAARRSLLPSISLSASTGTASDALKDILRGEFFFWTLAGNLIQPLFDGGRLAANVDLSDAAEREAANNYISTVLTAFGEVETALSVRASIDRRVEALCSGADAARQAETISFNRYRQGIEPFLTVLESQQRALSASSNCLSGQADALSNFADLMIALGGGFEIAPQPIESMAEMSGRGFEIIGDEFKDVLGLQ